MKILWLTIDRSARVARIFEPVREQAAQLARVSVYEKTAWKSSRRGWKEEPAQLPRGTFRRYDVVFTDAYFAWMNEDWARCSRPAIVLWEDVHGAEVRRWINHTLDEELFALHLVRYRDASRRFFPALEGHAWGWLPHSVEPERFAHRRTRDIGALLTGRISVTYPLRREYLRQLGQCPWFHYEKRPDDEDTGHRWPVDADYARLLARACLGLSSTSRYQYPILKTFELPAARTVLVSDWINELADLGFKRDENMLGVNPEAPLVPPLKALLENPAELRRLAAAGHELVLARHTAAHRADHLMCYFEQLTDRERITANGQRLVGCSGR